MLVYQYFSNIFFWFVFSYMDGGVAFSTPKHPQAKTAPSKL